MVDQAAGTAAASVVALPKMYLTSGKQLVLEDAVGQTCEALFAPLATMLKWPINRLQLIVGEKTIEYAESPVSETTWEKNEVITVVKLSLPLMQPPASPSQRSDSADDSSCSSNSAIWIPPPPPLDQMQ